MKSKIFAVATFAFAMAFAFSAAAVGASEIYTPASGFLKVGSGMGAMAYQAPNVMAAQKALNACLNTNIATDGKYGPVTAQTFKNFQIAKSLKIDGVIGNETATALAACSTSTTPSTPSTGSTLQGGAGSLEYSSTSTGIESDVKEGTTENVLVSKLEADGSDVAVTSVKVSFENNSGNGSTRLYKYVDEVVVMLGDDEVGSMSADDFSKDGDIYSKSIPVSEAVVKEGEKANLYVAVKTLSTVDDETATFDGIITQVRWNDATGAIFSDSDSDGSDFGTGAVQTFGFDAASADDSIDIKSTSSDPEASTLLVDADASSDEHLLGVFKLDVDEDSSDITVSEFPILVTFVASGNTTDDANADDAENYIEELVVSVDGEEYTATMEDEEITDGAGTAVYVVDDEFTIDSGDVVDVKIYATFAEQDGNYGSGATVAVSTDESVTENTPDYSWSAEGEDEISVGGSYSGEAHTLSTTGAKVSSISWVASGGGASAGALDFFFTVEAENGDVEITDDAFDSVDTLTTSGSASIAAAVVTKVSGTATGTTDAYTVEEGNTARFRVRYAVSGSAGSAEVTVTEAAGNAVSDDKELSPTIYLE